MVLYYNLYFIIIKVFRRRTGILSCRCLMLSDPFMLCERDSIFAARDPCEHLVIFFQKPGGLFQKALLAVISTLYNSQTAATSILTVYSPR